MGYFTMFILQNSKSVDIKPASKKYAVVLWARTDYLKKTEAQLSDEVMNKLTKKIRITVKDQFKLLEKK